MSRFIKKAGQASGTSYSDANVCALLSQYTGELSAGTLSASDSTNVCNTRGGWERVYYEPNYSGTVSSIVVEVDSGSYDAFCFQLLGFRTICTCTRIMAGISNGSCYCTCCNSAKTQSFTSGYNQQVLTTCACGANLMGNAGIEICGAFSFGALYTNGCTGTLYQTHVYNSLSAATFCNNMQMPKSGGATVPWPNLKYLKAYANCVFCASNGAIQVLGLKRGSSDIGVS